MGKAGLAIVSQVVADAGWAEFSWAELGSVHPSGAGCPWAGLGSPGPAPEGGGWGNPD